MITRIVKLEIKEGQTKNFEDVFNDNKKQIIKFEGCFDVDLYKDTNDELTYFTISKWESEQHLNDYRKSDFFANLWPDAKSMFSGKAQAWSLEEWLSG